MNDKHIRDSDRESQEHSDSRITGSFDGTDPGQQNFLGVDDDIADVDMVRSAMRNSTIEGMFALVYLSVTTATILIGLLISLGASSLQIGIAAAMPLLGGIFQPIASEVIRRSGGWRRMICVIGMTVDSLLWIVSVVAIVLLPAPVALTVMLCVMVVQQVANHTTALAWNSWMSDLIPPLIRGRYFGKRSLLLNTAGAITAVLAGVFIDHIGEKQIWSFVVVILLGVAARLFSTIYMRRQPEPFPAIERSTSFLRRIADPFRDRLYRRYLKFVFSWEFSVQLAAPFFVVYMIRVLGVPFSTVALLAGLTTLANILGQRTWGELIDQFGNRAVLSVTSFILAIEPVAWLLAGKTGIGFSVIVLIHIFAGLSNGGFLLSSATMMMSLAPTAGKNSFFAMHALVRGASAAAGPILAGLLLDRVLNVFITVPPWMGTAFTVVFLLAFSGRLLAWVFLQNLNEPKNYPTLHVSVLLSEFGRSFNVTQGYSLTLQSFSLEPKLDDRTIEQALEEAVRNDKDRQTQLAQASKANGTHS